MKKQLLAGWAIGVLIVGGASLAGATQLIANGSFEDPDIGSGWSVFTSIPDWDTVSGPGIEIQHDGVISGVNTPYGDQYVELDSHYVGEDMKYNLDHNTNSAMMQIVDTELGSEYDFSFAYSPRPGVSAESNRLRVQWYGWDGNNLQGAALWTRDFWADGANGAYWTTFQETLSSALFGQYSQVALVVSAWGDDDTVGMFVDNFQLNSQPVPEPATMLLLGSGLAGLAALKRRRKADRG